MCIYLSALSWTLYSCLFCTCILYRSQRKGLHPILNRKDATETYKPLSLSIIKGWDIRKRNVEYSNTIMIGLSKEALGCYHLVRYPQRPALGIPLENNITVGKKVQECVEY